MTFTHADLVERAARWLRNTKKLQSVLSEIGSDGHECPDVIAWSHLGESWLVECKVSRSDFLVDAKKSFRANPTSGLGTYRVFATPPKLIRPEELPPRWGLIEVRQRSVKVVRKPSRHELPVWVHLREKRLLTSAVRRAQEGWGQAVFGDLRPLDLTKCDTAFREVYATLRPEQRIEVRLRTTGSFRSTYERGGLTVLTMKGVTVTGSIPAAHLPRLLAIPQILGVEFVSTSDGAHVKS